MLGYVMYICALVGVAFAIPRRYDPAIRLKEKTEENKQRRSDIKTKL